MISRRNREAGFLVAPAIVGALGAVSVASAKADGLDLSSLATVVAMAAVFIAMHLALRVFAPHADPYLLPLVGVLVALGLVQLSRIDPALARDQAIWVTVGAAVFIAVLVFLRDYRILQEYRYLIGLAAVGLLLITMVFGTRINGAKLWIDVGGGQTVQLGELAKVLMVIFLAGYLRDRRELLAIPTQRVLGVRVPPLRHLAPVIMFVGVALAAVVVLNDFGTGLLFVGVFLAMLFLATGRLAYPVVGVGVFVLGGLLVYLSVPRIRTRVSSWISPFDDPQNTGYQMVQSLYSLADGGVLGPGLGRGFLVNANGQTIVPELRTDFIFSAFANELGYVGALAILTVFVLVAFRGFMIAAQANDGFSKLLAGGLTTVIALQTFLIVGGNVRLLPLTGVTLPFLSYGGSSVVTNFGLVALLLVISHRSRIPAGAAS